MSSRLPKPSALPKPNFRVAMPVERIGNPSDADLKPTSVVNLNKVASAPNINNPSRPVLRNRQLSPPPPRLVAPRANIRRSKSSSDMRQMAVFKKPTAPLKRALTITRNEQPSPKIARTVASTSRPVSTAKAAVTKPKIAAYDYKSRYNDLQPRYKDLKSEHADLTVKFVSLRNEKDEYALMYDTLAEENNVSKNKLASAILKIRKLEQELIESNAMTVDVRSKYNSSIESVAQLTADVSKLENQVATMTTERDSLIAQVATLEKTSSENSKLISTLTTATKQQSIMLNEANLERKRLHNSVQNLQGNIRVYCRIRPAVTGEMKKALCDIVHIDQSSFELKVPTANTSSSVNRTSRQNKMDFSFDLVFQPQDGQSSVFENVEPLVQSALDGYNICVIAYGQTGSGKTYTMEGVALSNEGIIPRTVDAIFSKIDALVHFGWDYKVRVSCLEIYNETIKDLLCRSKNRRLQHDIKLTNSKGTDITVTNLDERDIVNAAQLKELLLEAQANRATAATFANDLSSRSHSVSKIQLTGCHCQSGEILKGTINLVDLAGSESPSVTLRMDETKNINKSLSVLGQVLLALQKKTDHIPYRDSKLTFLLSPCLGGNSKTLMFINVAPFEECFTETMHSLNFGSGVRKVKTGVVKRNRTIQ